LTLEQINEPVLPADSELQIARLRAIVDAGESVDLHAHSRHSDGDWSPPDLVADAARLGLALISLTDHDTVDGQRAAARTAGERGLLFLNGMEVSLTVEGRLYHVLAYDFDPNSATWGRFAAARARRFEAYQLACFDNARARGYPVDPDVARDEAGRLRDQPLAYALERGGFAPTPDAARQLARDLALPRPPSLTYQDVFEFADLLGPHEAVFSVAHPARNQAGVSVRLTDEDLRTMRRAIPVVALEATHPYHSAADVAFYADLASMHGLAVTCGSDAHGQRLRRPLQRYSAALCRDFLNLIAERWSARSRTSLVKV
jgi:predicted metal-dependent phosphoesterase TrpH